MTEPTFADFETVAYQARVAAADRPCGSQPCDLAYPATPSRWCSGCLIAALLHERDTNARLADTILAEIKELEALIDAQTGDLQHYRQRTTDQKWERKP